MLDHEAGEIGSVIGHEIVRGKGLDLLEQGCVDTLGARDRLIVEEMPYLAGSRLPAHVLLAACPAATLSVAI